MLLDQQINFAAFRPISAIPEAEGEIRRQRAPMSPEQAAREMAWIEAQYRRRCAARNRVVALWWLDVIPWLPALGVLVGAVLGALT